METNMHSNAQWLSRITAPSLAAFLLAAPAFGAESAKAVGSAGAKVESAAQVDDAQVEAKLVAARERLEAAAREVAELSGQLSGPMTRTIMVNRFGSRAMLGVTLGPESPANREGVAIESVTPSGPASDAGLKAGDVLVSVDGKSLTGSDAGSGASTLVKHMRSVKPGDKVKVEYLRAGKKEKAEVVAETLDPQKFARYLPRDHLMMAPSVVAPMPPGVPMPPNAPFTMAFRGFGGHGLHEMELITLTPKLGQYFGTDKGVLVVRPPQDSELKLEEGDVIVDIDGRAPQTGSHAMRILRSYQPGEKVNVNVLRNRKSVKLQYEMPKHDGDVFFEGGPFESGMMFQGLDPAGTPGIRIEKMITAPPVPPDPT